MRMMRARFIHRDIQSNLPVFARRKPGRHYIREQDALVFRYTHHVLRGSRSECIWMRRVARCRIWECAWDIRAHLQRWMERRGSSAK